MKNARLYVVGGLVCLMAGFLSLHFANQSGTAQDVRKGSEANADSNAGVGTVLMWWGSSDAVPAGWEVCDGEKATTPNASLAGIKPNLINRFPKGASSARRTISDLAKGQGGSNNMPALRIAKIDGLKIVEDGAHSHSPLDNKSTATDGIDQADNTELTEALVARAKPKNNKKEEAAKEDPAAEGMHSHDVKGFVGTEKGIDADGNDDTGANQPAFAELFFIIRVK